MIQIDKLNSSFSINQNETMKSKERNKREKSATHTHNNIINSLRGINIKTTNVLRHLIHLLLTIYNFVYFFVPFVVVFSFALPIFDKNLSDLLLRYYYG